MSYTSNYSGKQIDEAVGTALGLISGTETIITTAKQSNISVKLNLPFTPTLKTRVIATLRSTSSNSNPTINLCLTLQCYKPTSTTTYMLYAVVCPGQNDGTSVPTSTIPAGTYYVDWLVLDKGD